ncbi:PCNA-associated factor [Holothuria leucospilota]|uniref:PCNA-associated factor n=1 Tax=Holothuria leucospilota TaxID=206669 RepID=A0A9Q0YH87_HOLLE|nr:PCNA-associated factor [Holothuria leucospilota]
MVRTRADNTARKAVAAKAPRKNFNAAGPSSNSTSPTGSKSNKHSGGNPYCPRPTPEWQKEITNFFIKKPKQQTSAGKENEDPEMDESGASRANDTIKEKEEKVEEDKAAEKDEDEMMEVEIEIKDKKMEEEEAGSSKKKRESPRPFQKNNCISDDSDDDE